MIAVPAVVRKRRGAQPTDSLSSLSPLAGNGLFNFYLFFVVTHFLRLSDRVPGVGVLRPTLLMVVILTIGLFLRREELKGRLSLEATRRFLQFAAWIVVSLPFVEWPGSVLNKNIEEWVRVVVFFFFTVLIVDSFDRLRVFVAVFVGTQIFRVLEPLFLHITTGYWGDDTYIGQGEFMNRLSGGPHDVINPNGLGFVIASVLPFIYFLWIAKPSVNFIIKVLALAIVGASLYALLLSASRSGFLSTLLVTLALLMKAKRKIVFLGVVAIIGAVGFANMTDLQRDRYFSLVSDDTRGGATAHGRVEGVKGEFSLGMKHPIFGHGLGTSGEAKFHRSGGYQVAHNLYTELLIETGFPGLILFLLFISAALKSVGRLKKTMLEARSIPEDQRNYLDALTNAVQVWAGMCFFISLAYYGVREWHWYLMGGICVAMARVAAGCAPANSTSAAPLCNEHRERLPAYGKVRRKY